MKVYTHTHTHPFNGPFSGTTRVSRYQKGKTNLDSLKQETVSGSGISWAICKSAPHSRQITTPAPPQLSFLQAGCPSCRPTNSVKALKEIILSGIYANLVCFQPHLADTRISWGTFKLREFNRQLDRYISNILLYELWIA